MCTDKELDELRKKADNSTKKLFSNERLLEIIDQYIDEMIINKDNNKKYIVYNSRRSMKNTWAKLIKERMIERGLMKGDVHGIESMEILIKK